MAVAVGGVFGIVIVAIAGPVIGAIATLLMPGPDPGGWFVTILLGIAGSRVGILVCESVGHGGTDCSAGGQRDRAHSVDMTATSLG